MASDPGRARIGVHLPELHFTRKDWKQISVALRGSLPTRRRARIQQASALYVAEKLDARRAAPDSALGEVATATDELLLQLHRLGPDLREGLGLPTLLRGLHRLREDTRGRDRRRGRPRDEALLTSGHLLAQMWEETHGAWPGRRVARIGGQERDPFSRFLEVVLTTGVRAAQRQHLAELARPQVAWAVRDIIASRRRLVAARRRGMEENPPT